MSTYDTERATALYEQLEPDAKMAYWLYYSTRTPSDLQDQMRELVEAGLTPDPPPPDPTKATVSQGNPINVIDQAGAGIAGSPATAQVTNGVLIGAQLSV